jgi:valyl-tRNA synthetase
MICSYGDYTDVLLFRELGLEEIVALDEAGRMSEAAGPYRGLSVEEARRRIVEDLEAQGLVVKREQTVHRTPTCSRSHNPIEIVPMKEFYLKQLEFKDVMRELAEGLIFHPEMHRQILLDWIDSVRIDWPISRRRYYATEIPLWYCESCGEPHVPEPGRYYQPWREPAPFERCQRCGGTRFRGETRTFDTWMDSSISPLFVTRYGRDGGFFKKTYPTALRPQAKDIIRTWLYYTLLRCYQLTGQAPFRHAWIMGYGVDEKGERMSKSRGNVIDPFPILKKYGADTFRFWAAAEANLGFDFRCSEARIAGTQKFLTKLWNTVRFVSSFERPEKAEPTPTDRWIMAELAALVERCMKGYQDFNFYIPANQVRDFLWNLYAPHYIEMVKTRAYGDGFTEEEQRAAWYALHQGVEVILLLLAPITPFITDQLWRELHQGESIHTKTFPHLEPDPEMLRYTQPLVEFNSRVWNLKKARGLSLKDPIEYPIPEELKPFEPDLKAMHRIKGV